MSRPDATASAQLDRTYFQPVYFGWLDVVDDPVRVNTSGVEIIISGSADADLNGTYLGATHNMISISPVVVQEGGSGSVRAVLSGIKGLDDAFLNSIGDRAKWKGRPSRLWRLIRDENNVDQGGIQHFYTGYMTDLLISGSTEEQKIELTIESYLAAFSQASHRTLLEQEMFDPGDLSARATMAMVNGNSDGPIGGVAGSGGSVGGGGGGGGRDSGFSLVRRL